MSEARSSTRSHEQPASETTGIARPAVVPPASSLFHPTAGHYGLRLALVFGNHAPGGLCPYYVGTRCHHCDIGAGEGVAFDVATNVSRLEWFRQHYADHWPQLAHLVVYNSGSVLNRQEMPVELLAEILNFARSLPALKVISLDSREPFIKPKALADIVQRLRTEITVRPILGLETANDVFRNELLEKQMPRAGIERAYSAVAAVGADLGANRVGLDVNIVIAGPGTAPQTAVADAVESARYAFELGHRHGISVDLNLHPYYPSARGLVRFPDHGRCPLRILARAVAAITEMRRSLGSTGGMFIGWNDEAHDQEPARRAAESRGAQQAFDNFNRTQDPRYFDAAEFREPAEGHG